MVTILKSCLLFLFALCFGILFSIPFATAQEGILDGKIFIGFFKENHKGISKEDELGFLDGHFYSNGYVQKGYSRGVYTAESKKNKIYFEAETMSLKQGLIKWRGVVDGDTIEVTYQWIKKGWFSDKQKDYSFQGTLKR